MMHKAYKESWLRNLAHSSAAESITRRHRSGCCGMHKPHSILVHGLLHATLSAYHKHGMPGRPVAQLHPVSSLLMHTTVRYRRISMVTWKPPAQPSCMVNFSLGIKQGASSMPTLKLRPPMQRGTVHHNGSECFVPLSRGFECPWYYDP